MARYVCSSCDKPVSSTHDVLQREKSMPLPDGKEDKITITGTGLGTWHCTCGADVRYVTVIRDLSGGKEADRASRSTPVTVKRHVAIKALSAVKSKPLGDMK